MKVDRNEVQLKESEERYQHLVQLLPDALIVLIDDRIAFANASALKLVGVHRQEEMLGQSFYRYVHPSYSKDLPAHIQYLLKSSQPADYIYNKLVKSCGDTVDIEMRAVAVKYDGRSAVQLIIRDITDRKKMEATLDEKNHLYKSLVESVVAGVFVIHGSSIVYANPYLAEMYGYSVEEMLKLSPNKLLDETDFKIIHKGIINSMLSGMKQFSFKCKGIRKDGSSLYLEGNSTLIMFDGHLSLLGTVQDVTFKHEQERVLRDSAKLYQKMIKFVPEPIIISDAGVIVYANKLAMQMVGAIEASEVIGKSVFEFIHVSYHEDTIQAMRHVMRSEEPTPYQERVIVCPDGGLLDVEISSIRINNYLGKDVMLSVIRDLTERKRAEEMLVRSEKLSVIGQLAAGVAHEIRNPLTALKGFTQLLRNKYPEQEHYFEIMANEIDRIALIVNEFMTLAKPHFAEFNSAHLEPILQSVINILETQAILMNVTIHFRHEVQLPYVHCNENQLKQVFLNVIKNGIEAMPEGGELTIAAEMTDDGEILISIHDMGPGIPEELIKKIGEPFVTTKEKGTGLGLMISTRIIEAHRGTLHISSHPGHGTVVEIKLPVSEQTNL
ncbi:PAS domain S-box protein [Paenibacillus sp. N4]|uniref:PAS domain S-box protein n=1 Tax=Paenibacillus vietnamensis TaxID=2590547 RepID=UPI001CD187A0|nr:PAS domain S-box protein [Paenibacillus vietnamensis]MCA0757486.1 PAS domain S-box protein [Paenibacillus vietnamensis]